MLDLSRPLDSVEGLTLYGDHEDPSLVYYLPDEIDLNQLGDRPDLLFQIFFPDEAVVGSLQDLEKAVGAILSVGVYCSVSATRLERARAAIASRPDFTGTLKLTQPPWEDGSVQLILLDTQGDAGTSSNPNRDALVRGVVGSRKPSLSGGSLQAMFHARVERTGAALITAALQGQAGSLAGVLYDLRFAALRPAIDLRMSADLNRVADAFSVGVGVHWTYVGADIKATFEKLREDGVIKVDMVSQVADPEAQRQVDEAVKDFYDVLMRELFKPTVPPMSAPVSMGTGSGSLVTFSFSYTHSEAERVVHVDYSKRSATQRTHNPQAHLGRLAQLGGGAAQVIQRVPLSTAWSENAVTVAVPAGFDEPGLRQVRAVLWRGRDAVLPPTAPRDGGLRMPPTVTPLADVALTAADAQPRKLAWVNMPDEPPAYRWQARFTYEPVDDIDSPAEVWTEPRLDGSAELDLFPSVLAARRRVVLRLGSGLPEDLDAVQATVVARDASGAELARRLMFVTAAKPEARWAVRRPPPQEVHLTAALTYQFKDGRSISLPERSLVDTELVANSPFAGLVVLSPLVVGAPPDVVEIDFIVRYEDAATRFLDLRVVRMFPPDYRGTDVHVGVLRAGSAVSWEAFVVHKSGEAVSVAHDSSTGGTIVIRPIGATRRVQVEWAGPTPTALGLTWVRASLRVRRSDGTTSEPATVEFRGDAVADAQEVVLPAEGQVEYSIARRWEDGRRAADPYAKADGNVVTIEG